MFFTNRKKIIRSREVNDLFPVFPEYIYAFRGIKWCYVMYFIMVQTRTDSKIEDERELEMEEYVQIVRFYFYRSFFSMVSDDNLISIYKQNLIIYIFLDFIIRE